MTPLPKNEINVSKDGAFIGWKLLVFSAMIVIGFYVTKVIAPLESRLDLHSHQVTTLVTELGEIKRTVEHLRERIRTLEIENARFPRNNPPKNRSTD